MPALKARMEGCASAYLCEARDALDPLEDVSDLLARAIVDEPPAAVKDGGVIREGYSLSLIHI